MNLPEKLRNMGIQSVPAKGEKVNVLLSDHKITALADVLLPQGKGHKGA
ncbi:hypothetical protein [Paenibacillus agaridevorans]|nr:hypothetical protein [Paenibacillus agaridevorans]